MLGVLVTLGARVLDVTDWALSVLVTLGALVLDDTDVTLSVLVTLGALVLVTGRPLAPDASPRLMLGVLVTDGVLMLPDLVTVGFLAAGVSPGVFLMAPTPELVVAAFLLVTAPALALVVFSGVVALLAPAAAAGLGM